MRMKHVEGTVRAVLPSEPGSPLPFTRMAFTPRSSYFCNQWGSQKSWDDNATTTLHSCLVSGALSSPSPYSSTGKELKFFQGDARSSSFSSLLAMRAGNQWPGYFRSPEKVLLDFTRSSWANSKIVFSLRCAIRAVQTACAVHDVARVHAWIEQHCFCTKFCRGGNFNFVGAQHHPTA